MPYQANIPQPTDQLSASQDDLLQNFASIYAAWNINHVTFDAADQGKHKYVNFPVQAAAPALAADAGFYALAAGLFVHAPGAANDFNITQKAFNTATFAWSYLPSGLLLKCGRTTTDALGHGTVNLNGVGTAYASVPFVFLTGSYTGGGNSTFASVRGLTSAQLLIGLRDSAGAVISGPVQWFTIGVTV